jgi:hypothetical protein
MPSRLVTVRSYFDPLDAEMALNHLRGVGVEASLADAKLVATTWHLANAVQGIKLQVPEQEVAKAEYYLAEIDTARTDRRTRTLAEASQAGHPQSDDDWDDEDDAEYDEPEDDSYDESESAHVLPFVGGYARTDEDDDSEDPPDETETKAERAFRGAAFGLIFIPLQFYVTWILLDIFFTGGRMRKRYRRRAYIAAILNFVFLALLAGLYLILGTVR